MKDKIIKITFILITILMSFSINKIKVQAADYCEWDTYQSFVDSNSQSVNSFEDKSGTNLNSIYAVIFNRDWALNLHAQYQNKSGKFETIKKFGEMDFESDVIKNGCPDYVKVYNSGANYRIEKSTKEEYKNYLLHQYDDIGYDPSSNGSSSTNVENLFSYVKTRPMVFAISKINSSYYNNNLHHEELSNLKKSNGEKIDFDFSKFGLSNYSPTFTSREEFYLITKNRWFNVMNNDMSELEKCGDYFSGECRGAGLRLKSHSFYNWFKLVGDFILEDSYETYLKAYKYAHLYDYSSEEEFYNATAVFDNVLVVKESDNKIEDISSNTCEVHCIDFKGRGQEHTECQKRNPYKKCVDSYNSCKHIGSASIKDQCLKEHMGEDEYNNFQNLNQTKREELEKDRDNALTSIEANMRKISVNVPNLNINFDTYETSCGDVVILHTIYQIIIILAPILVVIFGTFDYFSAVIASDEKKMQESKKKFPKRIILLILLFLVPLLISVILSFFEGDTTNLMRCIINGG